MIEEFCSDSMRQYVDPTTMAAKSLTYLEVFPHNQSKANNEVASLI